MNQDNKKQFGFTLVELSLAMSLVSVLLLIMTTTVIQIANLYNLGITIKTVNQSGRSLASEFQQTIAATYPFNINSTDVYRPNIYGGGRLCMGQYSYIWNNGSSIQDYKKGVININSLNRYSSVNYNGVNYQNTLIKLVKVYDPNSKYCTLSSDTSPTGGRYITYADAVELLNADQYELVIHRLVLATQRSTAMDLKTGQQLYNIEFVLGTNERDTINFASESCKQASDASSNPLYCSINRFNIVARAGDSIENKK